jgi:hypothetical protein
LLREGAPAPYQELSHVSQLLVQLVEFRVPSGGGDCGGGGRCSGGFWLFHFANEVVLVACVRVRVIVTVKVRVRAWARARVRVWVRVRVWGRGRGREY